MKELFKQAHKMTREIKIKYPNVSYQFQFALCLKYIIRQEKIEQILKEVRNNIDFNVAFQGYNATLKELKEVKKLSNRDIMIEIFKNRNDSTLESANIYTNKIMSYMFSNEEIGEMINNLSVNVFNIMLDLNYKFYEVAKALVIQIEKQYNHILWLGTQK